MPLEKHHAVAGLALLAASQTADATAVDAICQQMPGSQITCEVHNKSELTVALRLAARANAKVILQMREGAAFTSTDLPAGWSGAQIDVTGKDSAVRYSWNQTQGQNGWQISPIPLNDYAESSDEPGKTVVSGDGANRWVAGGLAALGALGAGAAAYRYGKRKKEAADDAKPKAKPEPNDEKPEALDETTKRKDPELSDAEKQQALQWINEQIKNDAELRAKLEALQNDLDPGEGEYVTHGQYSYFFLKDDDGTFGILDCERAKEETTEPPEPPPEETAEISDPDEVRQHYIAMMKADPAFGTQMKQAIGKLQPGEQTEVTYGDNIYRLAKNENGQTTCESYHPIEQEESVKPTEETPAKPMPPEMPETDEAKLQRRIIEMYELVTKQPGMPINGFSLTVHPEFTGYFFRWERIHEIRSQLIQNHGGQSMKTLCQRGGMDPAEVVSAINGSNEGLAKFDSVKSFHWLRDNGWLLHRG